MVRCKSAIVVGALTLALLIAPFPTSAQEGGDSDGSEAGAPTLGVVDPAVSAFLAEAPSIQPGSPQAGWGSAAAVQEAVGDLQFSVNCPESRVARERSVQVTVERAPPDGFDQAVLNTIVGTAQSRAYADCRLGGLFGSRALALVEVLGPDAATIARAQTYNRSWAEFRDVIAETLEAERQAQALREAEERRRQELEQARAEEAQRRDAARRIELERAQAAKRQSDTMILWVGLGVGGLVAAWVVGKLMASAARAAKRMEEERKEREAREGQERNLRRAQQEQYQNELRSLCSVSSNAFVEIPRALMSAEELLDAAERDFAEHAYSPFWDAIERTVNSLGDADARLNMIQSSAHRYGELVKLVKRKPPEFPVSPEAAKQLVLANATGARLREIVRVAQRDFQFATIFEQRKTNQILVSGFNNLGDALYGLGDQISGSIEAMCDRVDNVGRAVSGLHSTLERQHEEVTEHRNKLAKQAADQQNRLADQAATAASKQFEQAQKQLVMLDNIQRGKKPGYFEDRP